MIRGDNLVVNPNALEQLTGWAVSGTVEAIADGFKLYSGAHMQQVYDAGSPTVTPNSLELSASFKYTVAQSKLVASFANRITLVLFYTDGHVENLVVPLRLDIAPPDHISGEWMNVLGVIDLNTDKTLDTVEINVYGENITGAVTVGNISMVTLTDNTLTIPVDNANNYTNLELLRHLEDINNAHLSEEQKIGLTGGAERLRTIKLGLADDIAIANQNLYNNLQPKVHMEVVRGSLPLITPLYWQELLVSSGAGVTSTSVAIEKSGSTIGRVYVAYVMNNTLVVKSAQLSYPLNSMVWRIDVTIANCELCSLEFDGHFVGGPNNTVLFVTDTIPYLFYTTITGLLMYGLLGGPYNALANAVVSMDAVRGVRSFYGDIDQGLLIFYVISGSVYYNALTAGAWEGQQTVSIAPASVVSVRAERTADWRICLHITDVSGALYEVFTKMETSGWSGTEFISMTPTVTSQLLKVNYLNTQSEEYITLTPSIMAALIYGLAPVPVTAENIDNGEGDYGWKVRITFDELIFDVTGTDLSFTITDEDDVVWNSTAVEQTGDKTIVVTFQNWNNAVGDVTVAYTPGTIIGEVEPVETFTKTFTPTGLVPTVFPAPVPTALENTDTLNIVVTFDNPIVDVGLANGFAVECYEPKWVPGGENVLKSYTASAVDWLEGEVVSQTVSLGSGTLTDMEV